jgi:ParB-like chromosome segregation protein Spo0J
MPQKETALDKVRKAMAPATPKISWRQILKVHPAADKVPVASDDERRRLRGDLCRNGLIEPVVLVRVAGGPLKLLDGRHRLDGLQDNGVEVINSDGEMLVSHKVLDLADDAAALRMVLSLNLFRRHLSVDARRAMVKTLLIASPEISDRQGSKVVGLSHPTFAKERKSLEAKGDVEIFSTSKDKLGRSQPRARAMPKAGPAVTEVRKAQNQRTKERREIIRAEIEQFAAVLMKTDERLARQLHDILWGDGHNPDRLTGALARVLGIEDKDDNE